jgi:hypothetical protein
LECDVEDFVKTCDLCQRNKTPNQLSFGLLQPLPIPNKKWVSISMDLITQLPKTKSGYDAIVTFVDRLTKQIHLAPTTCNVTASQLASIFVEHVFKLHGLPSSIISDRDPRFTSKFWKALFKRLGTQLRMSTSHHPETDGQTERTNRTVEEMLRAFVNYKQNNWDEYLALVEFAYNNSIQASTGVTPFFANYGQHPSTPTSLLLKKPDNLETSNVAAAEDFVNKMNSIISIIQDRLRLAQDRQSKYVDKKRINK